MGKKIRTSIIDSKIDSEMWNTDLTPIVSDGNMHTVYITDAIDAPSEYNKMVHFLGMLTKDDTVTFKINNGGGYISSAWMIIDAIENCKAKTIAHISGTVASAATIITLSCDELIVAQYTEWLSHNYSGGVQGKGSEIKAQAEFMTKELETAFTEIHQGFFTKSEIKEIIADKDYWLNKKQIEKRWSRREKTRGDK